MMFITHKVKNIFFYPFLWNFYFKLLQCYRKIRMLIFVSGGYDEKKIRFLVNYPLFVLLLNTCEKSSINTTNVIPFRRPRYYESEVLTVPYESI